jgi:hypothetical protein
MKKIVFAKLWKYNAYCKIGSICFHDQRFGRVCMNQKSNKCERSLERLKGVISFNFLRKMLILPSEPNNRWHYWRIMGNETPIKVNKSKKTLDILNKSWSSPIKNGLNHTRIDANAIFKDDVTQEFHFRLMEFTLLQLIIKSNLL